tara:strand:- start:2340 stop:2873 length:534 start_codon:yes stop_codon:yes gene_type:complete
MAMPARPSEEYCQGTYDQLVFNGFPTAAKQMTGEPHYSGDFLAEFPHIPESLKADMQACAGMTAEKMIATAAAKMTPEEKAAARAYTAQKLQEHIDAKGGKGKGVVQAVGAVDSTAAYEEIMEAIDEEDALKSPIGFLSGDGLFGIPKAVWYIGGAFVLYQVLVGGARSYGRARGSR